MPVVAKVFIDGTDMGIMIDITSGNVSGPGNSPVYETTIDILCEKLKLKRIKHTLKNDLGPYKKIKENDQLLKNNDSCSICLENYQVGEFKRELNCDHCFHKKCVDNKWLKSQKTCPICRTNIYISKKEI